MQSELLRLGRVAILGAGREGQAAYHWLSKRRNLPISILAENPCDPSFADQLRANDTLWIEPFNVQRFKAFDLLIRSPGVSPYRESLQQAMDSGVHVSTPSNLWFESHPDANTICITGTKGKSTTSALLAHFMQTSGLHVRLAGNIGQALLSCPDEEIDWWVIELSSYQIADLQASPCISVILNYSPEHLDWHDGEANYKRDKFRLADLSGKGRLVLNRADQTLCQHFAKRDNVSWFNSPDDIHVKDRKLFLAGEPLPVTMPDEMPGHHNLCNVAAALTVSGLIGMDVRQTAKSVVSFQSLPHRLENLGVKKGVKFINDSIASTPVATLAALEALQGSAVVLLLGGLDRGLDWSLYAHEMKNLSPKAIIALPENGNRVVKILESAGVKPTAGFVEAKHLEDGVRHALALASDGDIVLLSPGAPSFPQFVDYRHRGEVFARLCGFDDREIING